jgi:hypothetical protein
MKKIKYKDCGCVMNVTDRHASQLIEKGLAVEVKTEVKQEKKEVETKEEKKVITTKPAAKKQTKKK